MQQSFEEKRAKTAERLGISAEYMPRHIAIIMDGNGRWAQKRVMPRIMGHRQGGKVVEKMALAGVDIGLESLTLYAFSTENWKRPKVEIEGLMKLYTQYLVGIRTMMMENNVCLLHLGQRENMPENLLKELDQSVEMTAGNDGMILGLALNYSGRNELIDVAKKIAVQYKAGQLALEDIDEECIHGNLYAPSIGELDLLIRTANEMRVSNFLLWQISYSEFYITETLWPDYKKADLEEAILAYVQRIRRFGNVVTR